jgi:hypothetical protein
MENVISEFLCEANPFESFNVVYVYHFTVGTADVAVWDVRKAMIAGKGDELYRFMLKNVEVGIQLIYDAVLKGYNVTQGTVIVNLDGFNIAQQGCIQCKQIKHTVSKNATAA